MATAGQVIQCRAAVAWGPKQPLVIETVSVDPPKAHEVRIKICYTAVCHTDVLFADVGEAFPCIFGHEGVGIVESVGDGVLDLQTGDHVLPLPMSQCRECECCRNPEANACTKIMDCLYKGVMPDNTTRFKCKGKDVKHFLACSTFTEYTVCPEIAVAKISPKAPLEKICVMSCGFPTGYGAVRKTCRVEPGSSVAIWGLGAVGLSAIAGAKAAGASLIVAIDTNSRKADLARKFGATDFVDPTVLEKPLNDFLLEKSSGGFQYTFECVGDPAAIEQAFEATRVGYGICCIVGCCEKEAKFFPMKVVYGRTIKGSLVGGYKTRDDFPKLIDDYLNGKLPVKIEDLITDRFELEEINKAIQISRSHEKIRSVITVSKPDSF